MGRVGPTPWPSPSSGMPGWAYSCLCIDGDEAEEAEVGEALSWRLLCSSQMRIPRRQRASGTPTAQPTMRPTLLCLGEGSVKELGGGISAVLVGPAILEARPEESDVAEVEKPEEMSLWPVEGEDGEEALAADVEVRGGAVEDGEPLLLPLPEA